ncbi:hypothetical protein AB0I94_02180 [Streptomyces sp. NPDC050147]|uniref:hypothetical protein n=1 Tax=Streptomyces sp. NPDC050147 TaxID=3155513 RepID=UPI00341F33DF
MSAPLVVNTKDGTCWTQREGTRGGEALYAPEKCGSCPAFVMATLTELAEHGIAGSADALPMPVGPQRGTAAEQLGDVRPASTGLVASLAKSVRDCREHEHPTWEDLYCLNLTSYMGERMAPVLRRLFDSEAEAERLRARVDELTADNEALQRDKEQVARVAERRLSKTDVAAWLRKKARECPSAPERQESAPAAIARLADKVARGAIRVETGGVE